MLEDILSASSTWTVVLLMDIESRAYTTPHREGSEGIVEDSMSLIAKSSESIIAHDAVEVLIPNADKRFCSTCIAVLQVSDRIGQHVW